MNKLCYNCICPTCTKICTDKCVDQCDPESCKKPAVYCTHRDHILDTMDFGTLTVNVCNKCGTSFPEPCRVPESRYKYSTVCPACGHNEYNTWDVFASPELVEV